MDILTAENLLFMLRSAGLSLVIASISLVFGTILGVIGAAGRISRNKVLRGIATVYVEIIRGTPMLLQILFFYLGIPSLCLLYTSRCV